MEITNQEFKHCDMFKVKGRVDSSTAPQFTQALEKVTNPNILVNLISRRVRQLNYWTWRGFWGR